jgi:hypothetical protein
MWQDVQSNYNDNEGEEQGDSFINYFSSDSDDLYIMSYCTEMVLKMKEMLVIFFWVALYLVLNSTQIKDWINCVL